MSLTATFTAGSWTCHMIEGGTQWLDGGAMFGIVPKALWQRVIEVDEKNRIPLAMRCLLIEHDDGLVLIDTALGNKENDKFKSIYGVDNGGADGRTHLEDGLRELGYAPEDVATVVNTHLHFDHAGGNTYRTSDGRVQPSFPNATYVVQRKELEFAMHTNERTSGSYLPPNFAPVTEAGRWRLMDGPGQILPGIAALRTPGHVPFHQSILVGQGADAVCFLADVIPTSRHVPLAWIMGYDLEPMRTLESKKTVLARAADEGWTLLFEHDPDRPLARAVREDDRIVLSG